TLKEASLEALGLASGLSTEVVALGIGPYAGKLSGFADRVLLVKDPRLSHPLAMPCARAFAEAFKKEGPDLAIISATPFGKEVAPLAGAMLGLPLMSDITEIKRDGSAFILTKPLYTGKVIGTYRIETHPLLFSVRPKSHPVPEPKKSTTTEEFSPPFQDADFTVSLVELAEKEAGDIDVAEADIIITGGRGMKGPENFGMLRELASVLSEKTGAKVAIGASRSAVDEGWIDHSHQVGQTGKIVSPGVYFAVGVSGAMQHLAGMRNSKIIIAINKDPDAPIFSVADFGVVDDLFKVVPELINRLKAG
ncbi:MAG: electron transfer flavoprotein subunit alpha/FixB family protein, partial [candidate division WOR-3 bacterium]